MNTADLDYMADLAIQAVRSRATRVWLFGSEVMVESLEAKFFTLPVNAPADARVVVVAPPYGTAAALVYEKQAHTLAWSDPLAPAVAAIAADPDVQQVRLAWRDGRKSLDIDTLSNSPTTESRCRYLLDRHMPKGGKLPAPGVLYRREGLDGMPTAGPPDGYVQWRTRPDPRVAPSMPTMQPRGSSIDPSGLRAAGYTDEAAERAERFDSTAMERQKELALRDALDRHTTGSAEATAQNQQRLDDALTQATLAIFDLPIEET